MKMTKESIAIKLLWLLIIIASVYLIFLIYRDYSFYEKFENSEGDIYQNIIRIYYSNLNRSPTTEELKTHTTAITNKEYDYDELELRIINSDEYQRLIKTQTDIILPETSRIIEEKELIDRIVRIYRRIRNEDCPTDMYLPLKDLYIYFEYNIYKFVALLRDSKYLQFEDEVRSDNKLSKESLIEKYLKTFDNSKLNYDATALKDMDATLSSGSKLSDVLLSSSDAPISEGENRVNAMAMLSYFLKNMKDDKERAKKLEEEERLKKIQDASKQLEKQKKQLVTDVSTTSGCTTSQRVYLPDEAKILNTEYGFRQIHKTPPICIPVGKPNNIPEIIIYNNGLQGTNIDESMDTQVGSIMPKFEYVRYIDIPVAGTTTKP